MRRLKLRSAVVAGLCVLLPLCVFAQEPEIVKSQGRTEKIRYHKVQKDKYFDALTRQDHSAAQQAWAKVRETARWLVKAGMPRFEKDDIPMPWPWGNPPPTGGSGGGSQPDSTSSDDQVQPISVDIFDWLKVGNACCEPVERPILESQTGYPDRLTTVDVTVHGRVVDQTGMPVRDATVSLTNDGKKMTTDSSGEFSLKFYAEGFGPVDIPIEIELVCSCLSIEPVEVGFATILPTDTAHNSFSIYNSCETSVDVTMPAKTKHGLSFEVEDCSGGHSSLGSFVKGTHLEAQLGPGARCTIKVTWDPDQEMMLDQWVAIPNSASRDAKCRPMVRIVGAAGPGIHVYPRELRYDGVVEVGDTTSLEMNIINPTQNDITVQGISFEGPHGTDFTAKITYIDNAQRGTGGDVLLRPGGDCLVRVDYSPKQDGVRLGTLIVRSTDTVAPRILVPLSGLAEYRVGPPGTTSTIRVVPGSTAQPQKQNVPPKPAPRVDPPPKQPEPAPPKQQNVPPPKAPNPRTQARTQSGPAQGMTPRDVLIMKDGSETYLYSLNPNRQHGMVLQEGADIDIDNGTLVFTNDSTRAAFAGDKRGSTVFVLDSNSKLNTGIHRIGTKKTLWAKLEDGALAFWELTRDLAGDGDSGTINIDISTPNAKVTPEGTAFWLAYDEENSVTELSVFDGRVAFQPVGIDLPPVWVEPGYVARATGSEFPLIEVGVIDENVVDFLYETKLMPAVLEVERQR